MVSNVIYKTKISNTLIEYTHVCYIPYMFFFYIYTFCYTTPALS